MVKLKNSCEQAISNLPSEMLLTRKCIPAEGSDHLNN